MTSASDFYAQAITRRRFGQWGLVAAMAGVAGCGGGGGFALQQGAMARLPDELLPEDGEQKKQRTPHQKRQKKSGQNAPQNGAPGPVCRRAPEEIPRNETQGRDADPPKGAAEKQPDHVHRTAVDIGFKAEAGADMHPHHAQDTQNPDQFDLQAFLATHPRTVRSRTALTAFPVRF